MKIINVGTKVLFVVTLVTNLLIGSLIYTNIRSSKTVEQTSDDVIALQRRLNENLRSTIAAVQADFLALPALFQMNPQKEFIDTISNKYHIAGTERFDSREDYKSHFSRSLRKDLSKGKIVMQRGDGTLNISYGLLDNERQFTDKVIMLRLETADPEQTISELGHIIADIEGRERGEEALLGKVMQLREKVAEVGIKSEKTRNEILQYIETINTGNNLLEKTRHNQERTSLVIGAFAIMINLLLLFLLIRFLVERPLTRLTECILNIQNGDMTAIPYRERHDQIGILSGAIDKFRQALINQKEETERKTREKLIIDEIFQTTTTMIEELSFHSQKLVDDSKGMRELAQKSGTLSGNVNDSAQKTADYTHRVSLFANDLSEVIINLHSLIEYQGSCVHNVLETNRGSRDHMQHLSSTINEIGGIISIVQEITEQTHLLALNATIEAARAGEAGKGFAVVAGEMKDLSSKTRDATSSVQEKIQAITVANTTMTTNLEVIDHHLDKLEQATEEILEGITSQEKGAKTITSLAEEASKDTHSVSASIAEVAETAHQAGDLSQHVHNVSNEVAHKLTILLNQTTSKLRLIKNSNEVKESGVINDTHFEQPAKQVA